MKKYGKPAIAVICALLLFLPLLPLKADTGEVSLQLFVSMTEQDTANGLVRLLFQIRNDSDVPISDAYIAEAGKTDTPIMSFTSLPKGMTSATGEVAVGADSSTLAFILTVKDNAGNRYVTEPVAFNIVSTVQTSQNKKTGDIVSGVIETQTSVLDFEQYLVNFKLLLPVLLLAGVLLLFVSLLLHSGEKFVLKNIPELPRNTLTEHKNEKRDTAKLRFGYVKPAKQRYPEQTAGHNTPQTGSYRRPARQITMLTREDTHIFAAQPAGEKAAQKNRTRPKDGFSREEAIKERGKAQTISKQEQNLKTKPEEPWQKDKPEWPRSLQVFPLPRVRARQDTTEIIHIR